MVMMKEEDIRKEYETLKKLGDIAGIGDRFMKLYKHILKEE